MKLCTKLLLVLLIATLDFGCVDTTFITHGPHHPAVTHAIPLWQLELHNHYDPVVNKLIVNATALSKDHLAYRFGGANPASGGMDCSGVIYYLLKQMGVKNVPRSAYQMYLWTLKSGKFYHVHTRNLHDGQFAALKPGDFLFWSGTYKGAPPISHVMIYLGKNMRGQPLTFGADDGFPYQGKLMWGVSVYDFILPNAKGAGRFVGYSCVPHLTC